MAPIADVSGDPDKLAGKFGLKPDQVKAAIAAPGRNRASGEDGAATIASATRRRAIAADKIGGVSNAVAGGLADRAKIALPTPVGTSIAHRRR